MTASPEVPVSVPSDSRKGLAITSLVLGILALILGLFLVGGALGLIGLVFGVVHLAKRPTGRGMAWAGLILSLCGLLLAGWAGYTYYRIVKIVQGNMANKTQVMDRWIGMPAPDVTVTTLDGKTITLSELRGKRVVLDFWATWCPPCRMEIPHFVQLATETPADQLAIVGISSEPADKLKPFVEENKINYPIASATQLPSPYEDVTAIPTTFFIDRNGVITKILVGYHDYENLKSEALAPDFQPPAPAPSETSGE
jgi:cytochrome c biogenesis protein CcmG/thiol:disulfide interchange protein DsbE